MVAAMERGDVQGRIDGVDWLAVEADLGRDGFARLPGLVSARYDPFPSDRPSLVGE